MVNLALHKTLDFFADLGFFIRSNVTDLGYATRMFLAIVWRSGSLLRRPSLVLDQILFLGNNSFVIIAVSGLFVGFVLGLQGYYTLNRYGSEQALGLLVALSLTRELGPVITALLFAGRAGTSLTAEIWFNESRRTTNRDGNDGSRSFTARDGTTLMGRNDFNAYFGDHLYSHRYFWRLFSWSTPNRRGYRGILGADARRGRFI